MKYLNHKRGWVINAMFILCVSLFNNALGQQQTWNPKAEQKPTPPWSGPQVEPQINVDIKDETKEFFFIQRNNDPFVYTRAYELKHANPYEVRNSLMSTIQSKRLADNDTRVECIKYNDGGGMILVTAEGYRFDKKMCGGGMSVDELIAAMDQPGMKDVSGTPRLMYFPKYVAAADLKLMIDRVGINYYAPEEVNLFKQNSNELEYGKGFTGVDDQLNALFLYIPPYNAKNALNRLKTYDIPLPQIKISCVAYEIDAERDNAIGADFQSWKNGPGADLFSLGGRWRRGWDPATMMVNKTRYSSTKYIQFSPRWNSKYLDFLAASSKAKVLTNGEIVTRNRENATLEARTSVPYFDMSQSTGEGGIVLEYDVLENSNFYPSWSAVQNSGYRVRAYDREGVEVTINNAMNGTMVLAKTEVLDSGAVLYSMEFPANPDARFLKNGKLIGNKATISRLGFSVATFDADQDAFVWRAYIPQWNSNLNMTYEKGRQVVARSTSTAGSSDYGYRLSITPTINQKATLLDISISNTSLIGFQSNGVVRTSNSLVETKVMADNSGSEIVIGGIEKKSLVRSVNKIPWLGSIPLLGWLFGNESNDLKNSRVVTVLRCEAWYSESDEKSINEIKRQLRIPDAEKSDWDDPEAGFNQYILDKSKIAPTPAP